MKVVIFSRVSTQIQDYTRQTDELLEYASKMGYSVEQIFEEKVSGAKKNEERKELMSMMEYINSNKIEKVLTWELSRIGQTMTMFFCVSSFHTSKVEIKFLPLPCSSPRHP
ncbi:MAG: recombinase family protein [Bacteroidetes bacterium]|nr:recombinase family protein [Bacteroidota bacterium]MDA1224814.1 recombinase family protein [Bacteroidota bacterium]